ERMLTMDGLLCLWVTASLASAHVALTGPVLRRGWWLLAGAACGVGLLTKGPGARALVAVPGPAFSRLDRRCPRVSWRAGALFIGAAVALSAPWYVLVLLRQPEFGTYFFWTHNVLRFTQPFDHAKPFWFYLPGLLLGMLPWALLLPGFG